MRRTGSAAADRAGELAAGRPDLAHHRALAGRPGLLAGVDVGLGQARGGQLRVDVAAQLALAAGRGLLAGRAVAGPATAQPEGAEDLRVVRVRAGDPLHGRAAGGQVDAVASPHAEDGSLPVLDRGLAVEAVREQR